MADTDFDRDWQRLGAQVLGEIAAWRRAHPEATLAEIEAALDAPLRRLRARVLADATLASSAAQFAQASAVDRPLCPECRTPLEARGQHTRRLQTDGGEALALTRDYGVCPTCGGGLFPP